MTPPEFSITRMDASQLLGQIAQFAELLRLCVDGGAEVTFLKPLELHEATRYWAQTAEELRRDERRLLAARYAGQVIGTVALALDTSQNGLHRAQVQKLLVHPDHRRLGVGQALMTALEAEALSIGRTLLLLDAQVGSAAEALYERVGYVRVGVIPGFALSADGSLEANAVFYKQLFYPFPGSTSS